MLSIGYDAFYGVKPKKVIWLTNTRPSGDFYLEGEVNYYTSKYPFLSSMFEVDGVKYVPVSPSERTCDAIDCVYDESAENTHIGNIVTNQGITLTVNQIRPYVCSGNKYIKNVNVDYDGDVSDGAFSGCASLETATLGEQVTSLGNNAFQGCSELQSIVVPDAVLTMGEYCFAECTSLKSVQIGTGIQTIEPYTFSDCSALTEITIPQSVTRISDYVFKGCI